MSKGKDESALNMRPSYAFNNSPNALPGHFKFTGNGALRFTIRHLFPYLLNIGIGKFGSCVSFALRLALFGISVSHVIRARSEEKMVRIHARSIITAMANIKPIRDWASEKLPRSAMSPYVCVVNLDVPVSLWTFGTGPFPALSVFSIWSVLKKSSDIVFASARLRIATCQGRREHLPLLTALATANPIAPFIFPRELFNSGYFSKTHSWNNIAFGKLTSCNAAARLFSRFIHTLPMFDFSEGQRLQPLVFALSGYQHGKEMQA